MLISSQPQELELLGKHSLKSVCGAPGPFVTVFLPARHPGAADLPRTDRLRDLLRAAAMELKNRQYQGPVDKLLEPFEELVGSPSMHSGGGDSVIFGSPDGLWRFRLPTPAKERLVVATHPHITSLLPNLAAEREFYVLALSKKHLRLGHWRDGRCVEVPLPASAPTSLEQFGGFDQPDHDLENRSASGPSTGQMRGVHFGTSAEREDAYLDDYFRRVDREIGTFLGGAPLVLIGVGYELAAYRAVAKHPRVLEAAPESPEHLGWPELARRAQKAIMAGQDREAELALGYFRETTRRDHVLSGVREVLEAAYEGRVHKLLLAKDAESEDLLGPLYPMSQARLEGAQDLLNAAAVETIRSGGEVYVLDPALLGSAGPIAAVLRYSH